MEYKSADELLKKAKEARNKTFSEIDKKGRLGKKQKGGFGHIIEESYFGYEINSKSEADFKELGIELKVTPIKKVKGNKYSAKERLVLNIINYMQEYNKTFETSSFWAKNEKLLLMFYEWLPETEPVDFKIVEAILYEYPEKDLIIIKRDWEKIRQFINEGKAHLLTEKDFTYLSPCTKGVNKNSLRQQPFSPELAKQRAYSFKSSYMTSIIREYITEEALQYFASDHELAEKTIEQLLHERFNKYIGQTPQQMAQQLEVTTNPSSKAFNQQLISALLGVKGTKLDNIAEFAKANIQFKTIRLKTNGLPKEHMSFVNINFKEVATEKWEESYLYNYFSETKFLFVVFQFDENDNLFFKGIKLWQMPEDVIESELFQYWYEIKQVINMGVQLVETKRGVANNLPKPSFNGKFHVRPKGRDGNDKVPLPDGQMIAKQSYWMNSEYVYLILNETNN